MTKILIVEDDRELQEGLVFALEGEGYSTRLSQKGRRQCAPRLWTIILL